MRIFAPGLYWWGNKGDFALSRAFIEWMRIVDPEASPSLTFTSFKPEADRRYYPEAAVLPMVTDPGSLGHRIIARITRLLPAAGPMVMTNLTTWYILAVMSYLKCWCRAYRAFPSFARWLVPRNVRVIAAEILTCDAVIGVPGGYLLAPGPHDYWWLFHLPTLALAKDLGAKVILSPCSIGPFHSRYEVLAGRILRRFDHVFVRERFSHEILLRYGVSAERITACPDLALGLAAGSVTRRCELTLAAMHAHAEGKPLLGISVREHHFPGRADAKQHMAHYLETVARTADRLVSTHGARVVVVAQTVEDIDTGRNLKELMTHRNAVLLLEDEGLTPSDLQHVYGQLRFLIGTRMHANILALSSGTPVFAIGYEPKTAGIMEQLGLSDHVIDIALIDDTTIGRIEQDWIQAAATGRTGSIGAVRVARSRIREGAWRMRELLRAESENSSRTFTPAADLPEVFPFDALEHHGLKSTLSFRGRRRSPETIVRLMREADLLLAEGSDLESVIQSLGISVATYRRWQTQYGGMAAPSELRPDKAANQ